MEIWSSNGQVQAKLSWGRAKVFIILGLQLQTELMDGAAPVPINSLGLPPCSQPVGSGGMLRQGLRSRRNWRGQEGSETQTPHNLFVSSGSPGCVSENLSETEFNPYKFGGPKGQELQGQSTFSVPPTSPLQGWLKQ